MKNKYYYSITSFILGICCFVAYSVIGSKIDADGNLIEPFALIPIGFLLIALSSLGTVVMSAFSLFNKPLKSDKWVFALSLGFVIFTSLYLFAAISNLSQREIEMSQSKE